MAQPRILLVDDDESLRRVTQVQLEQEGYAVATAADGRQALAALEKSSFDLVLSDLKMPGMSGVELLRRVRELYPEVTFILETAYGSVETAVEAMKLGAYDYVTKPVNPDALRMRVRRALDHVRLRDEVLTLRRNLEGKYGFENILGHSPALLRTLEIATRAARTDATVLIRGETGTGKELLAKGIHFNGERKDKPFVTINCGAIPRELIESELFGHVKGAFTGAYSHKKGKVELADGGTLFLDEIGDLPFDLQVKLLRLIQEREIEKVGEGRPIRIDVRLIAATHRDLPAMVEDGAFREDLFYRLNVIPLEAPPLRERQGDVRELALHFFARAKQKHGRPGLRLPDGLIPYLEAHRWPGNIRELENLVERLVVLASGDEVTLEDLPEELRRERGPAGLIRLDIPSAGISLDALEKELIEIALRKFDGNQTKAARYLDLSRKTLIYRMEKHGLAKG